jgi:cytochrome c556
MNRRRGGLAFLGFVVVALGAGSSEADLHDDRKAAMRHMARALRVLNDDAFDAGQARKRGSNIAATLQQVKDLFPAGSEHADGRSQPNIWTDRAGFEMARTNAYDAALIVAKSADAASFRDAFAKLAAACKACHDKYADLTAP